MLGVSPSLLSAYLDGSRRGVRFGGAVVVLAGRSQARLDRAIEALEAGERARAVATDVTREADVARLFEAVPGVDHLVMTAADVSYQPITEFDLEAARRVVDSKLLGGMLLAKHGAPRIRPGGSITFTTGIASERPAAKGSMVAAVNGALVSFARALAIELAPIRVNALSPGVVDTGAWDALGNDKDEFFARIAARNPARRIGAVEDIAAAAVHALTNPPDAHTVVHVDGGERPPRCGSNSSTSPSATSTARATSTSTSAGGGCSPTTCR